MARVVDASGNSPLGSGVDSDTAVADETESSRDLRLITTSDTVDLPAGVRRIYVGGAGNLNVVTRQGNTVLMTAVPVGTIVPVAAKRVMATNTTATLLIAMF